MKSGFVAILGRPNVGKSTLLNGLLNRKVSIVTDKSQTTRNNIKGILHRPDLEIVFVDTPGIHKPRQRLGEEMNKMAYSAAHEVDAAVLVVDASLPFGTGDQYLVEHLDIHHTPLIIVFNKIDLAKLNEALKLKEIYREKFPESVFIDTVAKERFNLDQLIDELAKKLPDGPEYYPQEVVTDKDEIFQIKEIIREKALKSLRDEVPHAMAIYMNDITWEENPLHIHATIIVEKESQKGIVIGAKGARIKEIGTKARREIESLLHKHVYLELLVKVQQDWRDDEKVLANFGYKNEK